jgi:hypothetical protein
MERRTSLAIYVLVSWYGVRGIAFCVQLAGRCETASIVMAPDDIESEWF